MLAACSASLPLGQRALSTSTYTPCHVVDGAATPRDTNAMLALRRSVESGALYTLPAAAVGVASCNVRYDAAVIELDYKFRDGGWLHVKRDDRIEFTEQEARFALSPKENPVTVLAGVERVAFGPDGCGIDWQQAETQPAADDPAVTETIFHGDVCNCQARIRRDAEGRVVGLMLRSAC